MTKTTKFWISPALELRHNIKGWPKSEDYVTVCDGGQHGSFDDEGYQKDLAQAKKDSILVEILENTWCELGGHPSYMEKDTFIDFHVAVDVVWQILPVYAHGGGWRDSSEQTGPNSDYRWRQVARLKPVTDARIKELEQDNAEGFEKYQELLIQNRNLKERVKELEAWKESQMNVNRDMLNGLNDKLPV